MEDRAPDEIHNEIAARRDEVAQIDARLATLKKQKGPLPKGAAVNDEEISYLRDERRGLMHQITLLNREMATLFPR